jgi:hypothetical protein
MTVFIAEHSCCTCGWTGLNRWVIFGFDESGPLWICPECWGKHKAAEAARAERIAREIQTRPLHLPKGDD